MTGHLRDVLTSACGLLGVPGTNDVLGLAERVGDVRQVVVLLVDGMGHHLLPQAAAVTPLLSSVPVEELTSPFPSTTPTSLVTLGTGVDPGEHGVLGFTVAVPGTDDVLTHITWRRRPTPTDWQPVPALLERAMAAGIGAALASRKEFRHSGLTLSAYGPSATFRVAESPAEVVAAVRAALAAGTGLTYAYHPDVDFAMHVHGIGSPEWLAAMQGADALIADLVAALPAGAALLVTADHGGLNVPVSSRVDVADDPCLGAGLRLIVGEPRVRYLHCRPGAAADVLATWRSVLAGVAEVFSRDEAIATGWFGPVAPRNYERIGDVVAVCTGDAAIFASGWGEPDQVHKLVGLHGSVTPAERAVPLFALTSADAG